MIYSEGLIPGWTMKIGVFLLSPASIQAFLFTLFKSNIYICIRTISILIVFVKIFFFIFAVR